MKHWTLRILLIELHIWTHRWLIDAFLQSVQFDDYIFDNIYVEYFPAVSQKMHSYFDVNVDSLMTLTSTQYCKKLQIIQHWDWLLPWRLMNIIAFKSPTARLFIQWSVQPNTKGNTKTPHYWPFVRGLVGWGPAMRKALSGHDVIMFCSDMKKTGFIISFFIIFHLTYFHISNCISFSKNNILSLSIWVGSPVSQTKYMFSMQNTDKSRTVKTGTIVKLSPAQ